MKFLYIEDDVNIAEIYIEMVKDFLPEVQINHFINGKDALDELKKNHSEYRLVISDYQLKEVSGADIFHFVNGQMLAIPFIILSGIDCSNDPGFKNIFKSHVRNAILLKPAAVEELVKKIKWCLHGESEILKVYNFPAKNLDEKVAIRSDTFLKINIVPCDVFLKLRDGKYIKVINKNELFEGQLIKRLILKGIKQFYVLRSQLSLYGQSLLSNLHSLLRAKKYKNDEQQKSQLANKAIDIMKSSLHKCGFHPALLKIADDVTDLQLEMIKNAPELESFLSKFQNFRKLDTEHSRLVSYIIVGILKELMWDSESTLHRMCTAALLHDFSLPENFTNKVCDRDNYRTLSEIELSIFYRHPEESAHVARNFEAIAPGIEQYILEHHELPNGEGFPKKLNHNSVHPLSVTLHLASYTADLLWKFDFDINKVKEQIASDSHFYHRGFYRKPYDGLIKSLKHCKS